MSHMGPFKCLFCASTFAEQRYLTIHMETHSNGTIKCDTCSKSFLTQRELNRHRKSSPHVHGEFFRHKTKLNRHLNAHTENRSDGTEQAKESSYQCYYCPLAFSTMGSLSSHEFVHTDPNLSIISFEKEACIRENC